MTAILPLSLQSMQQDITHLEHIASNLANALTPGYKRDVSYVQPMTLAPASFDQYLATAASDSMPATAQTMLAVQIDSRPGTLKATRQALDLAIAGPGYFEVQTEQGLAYTRQGNFRLDARGRLVTTAGDSVMSKSGDITLPHASPAIDSAGNIYESPEAHDGTRAPLAQLKIVQFDKPELLQRLGNGLLAPAAGNTAATVVNEAELQVRQGYVENANVSSAQEMVQLMQTMRHFESMQKVAVGYDEMLGLAIRKLGETS